MIRHNEETTKNGAPEAPNRLALNRLGPQKGSPAPGLKNGADSNGHNDDHSQNRLTAKKLAEEKQRARTVARAQAVAEKLSTATEQVSRIRLSIAVKASTASSWLCSPGSTDTGVPSRCSNRDNFIRDDGP